jgi:uncharacterized protein YgiB involved in biofilm formation
MARIYQDIASVLNKVESKEDSIRNMCYNSVKQGQQQVYAMVCGVLKCMPRCLLLFDPTSCHATDLLCNQSLQSSTRYWMPSRKYYELLYVMLPTITSTMSM